MGISFTLSSCGINSRRDIVTYPPSRYEIFGRPLVHVIFSLSVHCTHE